MMPNALKLDETVSETAKEVLRSNCDGPETVLIPASSGTIAAGVIQGFSQFCEPRFIVHLGYNRSHAQVKHYLIQQSKIPKFRLVIVDENYNYKDVARSGITPPWPCNEYYDLKAFRWWMKVGVSCFKTALFWNIG